jgi:hypothetical protein
MARSRLSISSSIGADIDALASTPDNPTLDSIRALEEGKVKAEILNYTQNTRERKIYAERIFQFTCYWSVFVAFLIIFSGLGKLQLSDFILSVLLGSTLAHAYGFFYLVSKYLFNEGKST